MTQDTQAGADEQPAPAQLPKTLRELAEVVHDWGKRDQAWAHPDPDCFDVALFGHISEDGEPYPVAEVNADTYGREGVSLQLAQFHAAASPAAVLALLDRVALRDNELKAARADAKHWRTNHDNVVARLRIFTQRPDIPKELADRLPWYRELVRLQAVEAQAARAGAPLPAVQLVGIKDGQETSLGPIAMPPSMHARELLRTHGFGDFEDDMSQDAIALAAMQSLIEYCQRYYAAPAALQAAPPAPAAVAVPELRLTDEQIEQAFISARDEFMLREIGRTDKKLRLAFGRAVLKAALAAAPAQPAAWMTPEGDRVVTEATMASARKDGGAMLSSLRPFTVALARAAAPAQAQDDRAAFKAYLQECDDCEIVPDVAGAFHAAWQKRAAPAQTVAVPQVITDAMILAAWSAAAPERAGDITPFHAAEMKAILAAGIAAAPAQEHATQLAGQALPADEFRGDTSSLVRNIVALLDLDAQGCLVPHGVGGHARGLLSAAASRLAAAPVQAQEDAAALEAPAAPAGLDDSELEDLAHSANQECLSFGMSLVPFLRLAKTVRDRALAAAPQAPAAPAVDARAERDAAFEAVRNRLCGLQRYSFVLDDDGVVRRAQDRSGNWIEFDAAHELFDPVAVDAAIDAARAAQGGAL